MKAGDLIKVDKNHVIGMPNYDLLGVLLHTEGGINQLQPKWGQYWKVYMIGIGDYWYIQEGQMHIIKKNKKILDKLKPTC